MVCLKQPLYFMLVSFRNFWINYVKLQRVPPPHLKFLSESWQNMGFAVHSLYRNPECATGIKPKLYLRFVTCVQLLRIYLLLSKVYWYRYVNLLGA